jgi:hypothetical protein
MPVHEISAQSGVQLDSSIIDHMHVFRSNDFDIRFSIFSETMIPFIASAPPSVTEFPDCIGFFDCPWKRDSSNEHCQSVNIEGRLPALFEIPPGTDEIDVSALLAGETTAHNFRISACFEQDDAKRIDLFNKAYLYYGGVLVRFLNSSIMDVVKKASEDQQPEHDFMYFSEISTFSSLFRRIISHSFSGMAVCALFGKLSKFKFVTLASEAVHWAPVCALELACTLRMLPLIASDEAAWALFAGDSLPVHEHLVVFKEASIGVTENVLIPLMIRVNRDLYTKELGLIRDARRPMEHPQPQLAPPASSTSASVNSGNIVERKCAACSVRIPKERTKSRCSGCMLVYYCGKECQTAHWTQHKTSCPAGKR